MSQQAVSQKRSLLAVLFALICCAVLAMWLPCTAQASGEGSNPEDTEEAQENTEPGEIGPHSPRSFMVGDDVIINVNYKNIKGDLDVTIPDELSGLTYANGQIKGKLPETIKGEKQDFEIALSGVGNDGKTVKDTIYLTVRKALSIDQLTDRTFANGDEVKIPLYVSPASVDSVKVKDETPLPNGLKFVFDSHGRQITGTVDETFGPGETEKAFPVTIVATKGDTTAEMSFTITVTKPGAGVIGPNSPKSYLVGDEAIINVNYKNIEGDLTATFPDELSGLTYANGQIKGKMPAKITGDVQNFEVVLKGTGKDGQPVEGKIYIAVYAKISIDQLTDRTFVNGEEAKIPFYVYPASVDSVKIKDETPLPEGLKYVFDEHGRQIVGTTAVKFAAGEKEKVFPVTIVAATGDQKAEMTFKITVKNPKYVTPGNPDEPSGHSTDGDTTHGTGEYGTHEGSATSMALPKTSDVANVAAGVVALAGLTLGAFGVMRRKVH